MRVTLAIALASALAGCSGTLEDGTGGPDAGPGGGPGGGGEPTPPPRKVDITGPDVLPHVQAFADAVCGATDACTMGTRVGHSPSAERALDILTADEYGERASDGNALGDRVAAFALEHQDEYGVMYVIWLQRYNDGGGWDPMEDRGSITANHFDHVHVSFETTAP